jgi:hypothetical protein
LEDSRDRSWRAKRHPAMIDVRQLLRQLAGHLMMGASLGALLAVWMLQTNFQRIFDVIAGSEMPVLMHAIFVIGLAGYFAFGAALTAFLFIVSDGA